MPEDRDLVHKIMDILRSRADIDPEAVMIPPPVFTGMKGEFVEFDAARRRLVARFPVMQEYLNPYGLMQGGMVTAAVDNTLGPLGLLVAPPNVTRRLEMKFSNPATVDIDFIVVVGEVVSMENSWLRLKAAVRDPDGTLLARAKATHWILTEKGAEAEESRE